jgi:hypothetical protein
LAADDRDPPLGATLRPTPLPLEALAAVLSCMTTRHGPMLSPAVRVHVLVHAVAGLAPGAYGYEPAHHALLRAACRSDLRAAARAAALDQDVVGDAAVVFVLSIDRATFAADPSDRRGVIGTRSSKPGWSASACTWRPRRAASARVRCGAFYDDEAAALVGVDPAREWVVHFAALGVKG